MGMSISTPRSRPARRKAAAAAPGTPTSVADALFTTAQQRLLALLFGQPSRSFYATDLIELTGSGSGAVQRELGRLSSSGLVNVSLVGKRKHYQANHQSPVFEELRGLVVKTVAVLQPIRQAIEPLADRISLLLIYGSVASGTATASSDIDLLVVADDLTLEDVYSALIPVKAGLDRRIRPTLYTSREFAERKSARNAFLTNVLGGDHLVVMEREGDAATAR